MITVTAFGPFGTVSRNPSEILGRALFGENITVLPVSYEAVDKFLDELPSDTEKLLMLGIAVGSKEIRIEREATDEVGPTYDNGGVRRCNEQTTRVAGRLLNGIAPGSCWRESNDAGRFLCNYIYYQATVRFPNTATGFVHVPPFSAMPFPIQLVRLRRLVNLIS